MIKWLSIFLLAVVVWVVIDGYKPLNEKIVEFTIDSLSTSELAITGLKEKIKREEKEKNEEKNELEELKSILSGSLEKIKNTIKNVFSPSKKFDPVEWVKETNQAKNLEKMQEYANITIYLAEKNEVPLKYGYAIPCDESSATPDKVHPESGAIGLWQVKPIAAKEVGIDPANLKNPAHNIATGMKYLRKMYDEFGDWDIALVAYNCGPKSIRKAIKNGSFDVEKYEFPKRINAIAKLYEETQKQG